MAIGLVTVIVSLAIIVFNAVPIAAVVAGFIPAIASGSIAPDAYGVMAWPWWVTPLTTTLVHGGFVHLALNMVIFAYCGRQVERALGWPSMLILYVVGAYASCGAQWLPDPDSVAPMIGASGAGSAIVAAYALLYGQRAAKPLGPIPGRVVHIVWLAAAWIGIQALVGYAGIGGIQIAIAAHIGGFITGLILTQPLLLWRYRTA